MDILIWEVSIRDPTDIEYCLYQMEKNRPIHILIFFDLPIIAPFSKLRQMYWSHKIFDSILSWVYILVKNGS